LSLVKNRRLKAKFKAAFNKHGYYNHYQDNQAPFLKTLKFFFRKQSILPTILPKRS